MKKNVLLAIGLLLMMPSLRAQDSLYPFRDARLPLASRVNDLLGRLTLEEKISLLGYSSKAVPRLEIPAYNWWNEALHGVARAGIATVFPQAIGLAATFNEPGVLEEASVISTEARAKYNLAVREGRHLQYMGLTFWSPNINIFRDPRWGRGQETYGEDPYLTGTLGAAFVRGMQGTEKGHLKTAACAKHFAVHSGPENERHVFNALVSEKDLRETYLYAFKKLVGAGAEAVMCAYNRVNNEPCCTSGTLLQNILRKEWKFSGHVVTDCWALQDVWQTHKSLQNPVQVAAAAIKAGVNLDCSNLLQDEVMKAVQQNLLSPAEVDSALAAILRTQVRLGFFDTGRHGPYDAYGQDSIGNAYHTALCRQLGRQSMVLLKNSQGLLPLDKNNYGSYMILGPNAASLDALLGNYHGLAVHSVSFVEGLTSAVGPGARVEYDMGCDYKDTTRFGGIWAAGNADLTIAVLGLTPVYEGEEGDAFLGENSADRKSLQLPASHLAFLKALRKANNKPIILVITGGSAVDIAAVEPYADAIIMAWYPGQEGGNALADILFGKVSPSGRLPVSFYQSLNDLPAYGDYAMKGRTYRYFKGKVQYPFGFGMSYTRFGYQWENKPVLTKDSIRFSIKLENTGNYDGDEVVQVYIHYPSLPLMPTSELKAFKRVSLLKSGSAQVEFSLPLEELRKWDPAAQAWKLYRGDYQVQVGGDAAGGPLTATLKLGKP